MSNRRRPWTIFSVVALTALMFTVLSVAGNTQGQSPITFSSESAFLLAVGDVVREGFEGLPTDSNCTGGGSTVSTGILTVISSPQAGGTSWLCVGTTNAGFLGPTEGDNALIAGSDTGDSFLLTFLRVKPIPS